MTLYFELAKKDVPVRWHKIIIKDTVVDVSSGIIIEDKRQITATGYGQFPDYISAQEYYDKITNKLINLGYKSPQITFKFYETNRNSSSIG